MATSSVVDDITRAAVDLFSTQGYANTSVQQIVEAAGVTKGAMYHYFESKDDLLFSVYERMLSLQTEHLEEIVGAGRSTAQTLHDVCVDVDRDVHRLPARGHGVLPQRAHALRAAPEGGHPPPPPVPRRVRGPHRARPGRRACTARTSPRAVLVAHFFSDIHYLSNWYSPEGAEDKVLLAQQLTDLFLVAIKA